MFYKMAMIFFISEPSVHEPPGMLADRFFVRREFPHDMLKRDTFAVGNKKEYRNPMMIRDAFEVPLHLLRRLHLAHGSSIHNILKFSSI